MRACDPKMRREECPTAWGRERVRERERERERESAGSHLGERERKRFGSSFYMFFPLPLDLPYANWA